jgi:hypothetical protein
MISVLRLRMSNNAPVGGAKSQWARNPDKSERSSFSMELEYAIAKSRRLAPKRHVWSEMNASPSRNAMKGVLLLMK